MFHTISSSLASPFMLFSRKQPRPRQVPPQNKLNPVVHFHVLSSDLHTNQTNTAVEPTSTGATYGLSREACHAQSFEPSPKDRLLRINLAQWFTSMPTHLSLFQTNLYQTISASERASPEQSRPRLALDHLVDEPQDPPALPPSQVPLIPLRRPLAGGRHRLILPTKNVPLIPEVPVVACAPPAPAPRRGRRQKQHHEHFKVNLRHLSFDRSIVDINERET